MGTTAEKRIDYLRYDTHKGLHEARLSFVHQWYVAVAPPGFLIYAVFHLKLGILYIQQMHLATCQCLCRHPPMPQLVGIIQHYINCQVKWGTAELQCFVVPWWAAVCEEA